MPLFRDQIMLRVRDCRLQKQILEEYELKTRHHVTVKQAPCYSETGYSETGSSMQLKLECKSRIERIINVSIDIVRRHSYSSVKCGQDFRKRIVPREGKGR